MLHELVVYTSDFEQKLLASSQTFIVDWSEHECADRELPDYVRESVKLIDREMKRCEIFSLDNTTRRDLLTLLEDHLIERRQADLGKLLQNLSKDSLETHASQWTIIRFRSLWTAILLTIWSNCTLCYSADGWGRS